MNRTSAPPVFRLALLAAAATLATAAAAQTAGTPAPAAPAQPVVVKAVATFGFDRAMLRPADREALLADVAKMKDVSWQSITTTGYTDNVGRKDYNEKLSARRAAAVKQYLVAKGIDGSMIQTAAKADEAPAADNSTSEGRAKNRRTEVKFRGVKPVGN